MRWWILGLALGAALVACGSDDDAGGARQVLDSGDVGTEITVGVGEQFEVRLDVEPDHRLRLAGRRAA